MVRLKSRAHIQLLICCPHPFQCLRRVGHSPSLFQLSGVKHEILEYKLVNKGTCVLLLWNWSPKRKAVFKEQALKGAPLTPDTDNEPEGAVSKLLFHTFDWEEPDNRGIQIFTFNITPRHSRAKWKTTCAQCNPPICSTHSQSKGVDLNNSFE